MGQSRKEAERKQEAGEKVVSLRCLQSGDARACHSGVGWNQPPQELAAYHGFWMSQAMVLSVHSLLKRWNWVGKGVTPPM